MYKTEKLPVSNHETAGNLGKAKTVALTISIVALSSFSRMTTAEIVRLPERFIESQCDGKISHYQANDGKLYVVATKKYLESIVKTQQWSALDKVVTTCVTDMSGLFAEVESFDADISHWDTSNVTDMSYMFSHAYDFNGDISMWDVSNVTNMNSMFYKAEWFNQDISNWKISAGTTTNNMYKDAINLPEAYKAYPLYDTLDLTDEQLEVLKHRLQALIGQKTLELLDEYESQ